MSEDPSGADSVIAAEEVEPPFRVHDSLPFCVVISAKQLAEEAAAQQRAERRERILWQMECRDLRRFREWRVGQSDLPELPTEMHVPIHFRRRNALLNVMDIFDPKQEHPVNLKAIHAGKSILVALRESLKPSRRRRWL